MIYLIIWFGCGIIPVIFAIYDNYKEKFNITLGDIIFFLLLILGGCISFFIFLAETIEWKR